MASSAMVACGCTPAVHLLCVCVRVRPEAGGFVPGPNFSTQEEHVRGRTGAQHQGNFPSVAPSVCDKRCCCPMMTVDDMQL